MVQVTLTFVKGQPPVSLIMAFRGDYMFLSNFESAPVFGYPTNENAYMAWKTSSADYRQQLRTLTPREAKMLSQSDAFVATHHVGCTDKGRVQAMLDINREKYRRHPALAQRLLDTGAATLVEGTTWGDKFFGTCMKTGEGQNYLGRILMTVRDELRGQRGLGPVLASPVLPNGIV